MKKRAATYTQEIAQDRLNQNLHSHQARRPALRNGHTTSMAKQQQTQIQEQPQQQQNKQQPRTTDRKQVQVDYDDPKHVEWRRQWRDQLKESHFFFDGIDDSGISRVKALLIRLGSSIEVFFDRNVTHIITRKPLDLENLTDLHAKALKNSITIWSLDTLTRFLANFTGRTTRASARTLEKTDLSQMLKQEKLSGATDRDVDTKRHDYYYFQGPYILVWDYSRHYRSHVIREYSLPNTETYGDWPQWANTPWGYSPFVTNHYHKPYQLTREDEAYKRKVERERKRKAGFLGEQDMPSRKVLITEERRIEETAIAVDETQRSISDRTKYAQCHMMHSAASVSQRFHEIVASGVNMSNSTSASRSVTRSGGHNCTAGNGLGPVVALVPSREVNNLKKRVVDQKLDHQIMIRKTTLTAPMVVQSTKASATTMEMAVTASAATATAAEIAAAAEFEEDSSFSDHKPTGHCENCHEEYRSYKTHAASQKHLNFANNPKNFEKLDLLLQSLERSVKRSAKQPVLQSVLRVGH